MPLGAAALAGTSYPINRERTAELARKPTENSLDSVLTEILVSSF